MPLSHWPPVSVVMPVLNEERHLEEAVGRVLDQEYPGELEVVLAIGPSKDRTQEIAGQAGRGRPPDQHRAEPDRQDAGRR